MGICIDFDGTVVTHEYPRIGKELANCVCTLQELIRAGHRLILFTMRSDQALRDAVQWFADRGLALYGINQHPEQASWTSSQKAYAQLYIDDAALGCPLVTYYDGSRPHVDWFGVEELLRTRGYLPHEDDQS